MSFEFSAGGIIFRKSPQGFELALVLDSFDKWTFPKGHIEKGEEVERAALREVGEEVGINNLKITDFLGKIDYFFKKEKFIHKFVYYYLMEAPSGTALKVQISELKQARWFKPHQAIEILGYKKDSLPILKKAIQILDFEKGLIF